MYRPSAPHRERYVTPSQHCQVNLEMLVGHGGAGDGGAATSGRVGSGVCEATCVVAKIRRLARSRLQLLLQNIHGYNTTLNEKEKRRTT